MKKWIMQNNERDSIPNRMLSIKNSCANTLDKIFMLPLSFYSIIFGALLGAIINILTSLLLSEKLDYMILLGLILLLISGILSIVLYVILDEIRASSRNRNDILFKVKYDRRKLYTLIFIIILFFILSLIVIYSGIHESTEEICQTIFLKNSTI
jgi:phosphate/sulfate permease